MERFGGIQEATRNDTVAVGTTSVTISDACPGGNGRKVIVIRNTSDDSSKVITVNFGYGVAVANKGIVLKQNEYITDCNSEGYQCWQGIITAICAASGGQVSVFER